VPPPPITTHKKPCPPTRPPPPPGTPPSPSGSRPRSPATPEETEVPDDTPPEKVQKIDDDRETEAPGEPSERAGSTSATSPLLTNVKDEEEEQGEAADSKDEDTTGEDPGHQSDPEAEQNECALIMDTVRALFAKEEAKLEGLSPRSRLDAEAKVECLKLARQLLQLHLTRKPECFEYEVAAGIVSDAKEKVAPPPYPQASEYMASKGFASFDAIVEEQTLVHHCCQDAERRMPKGPERRARHL